MAAVADALRCLNCESPLPRSAAYCPACGQATPERRFSARDWALKVAETLYLLLLRPGWLTIEWAAGRRQRYVQPRPLFVSVMLALVVVVKLLPAPPWAARPSRDAAQQHQLAADTERGLDALRAARGPLADAARQVLVPLGERLAARMRADGDSVFVVRSLQVLVTALYYASLVMFPLNAAVAWLAWRGSGMTYTQHLVAAVHGSSAWALVLGLAYLSPTPTMAAWLLVAGGLHSALQARALHAGHVRPAWRALLHAVLTLLLVLPMQFALLWLVATA